MLGLATWLALANGKSYYSLLTPSIRSLDVVEARNALMWLNFSDFSHGHEKDVPRLTCWPQGALEMVGEQLHPASKPVSSLPPAHEHVS